MAALNPPLLSTDLIRDGYDFYYHGVVGIAYGFDHWKWALVFLPLVLAVAAELVIFPLLPAVNPAFATAPWNLPDTERTVFELLAFPSLVIAPASIVYAIAGAVLANRSFSGLTVFGIISAAVSTGGGEIKNTVVQSNPETKGYRLKFELDPKGAELVELRAQLKRGETAVSELWLYRWTA